MCTDWPSVESPEQPVARSTPSALEYYTGPLTQLLADPSVTELCLQRPGELFIERTTGWSRESAPWATSSWAHSFARLVATATGQRVNSECPLLSATLPGGERVQLVLPPATSSDQVAIAIRRPSREAWSLAELASGGLFATCRLAGTGTGSERSTLAQHFASGNYHAFLALAVIARLNILVAGATGSGKTTLTKALSRELATTERLISIEDAAELEFGRHPNVVRLYYSKDGQGLARVTPKQLLEASLRLRPDRILLAELRGEEAYYFLRNVSSGHPGSITSVHAGSCELAFEQLGLLVKESAPARDMSLGDIQRLLRQTVEVVVHCARVGDTRQVTELWWRDAPQQSAAAGQTPANG